jgi:transcriptional regulator of heat shock response
MSIYGPDNDANVFYDDIKMNNHRITGLAPPTKPTDAVSKEFVQECFAHDRLVDVYGVGRFIAIPNQDNDIIYVQLKSAQNINHTSNLLYQIKYRKDNVKIKITTNFGGIRMNKNIQLVQPIYESKTLGSMLLLGPMNLSFQGTGKNMENFTMFFFSETRR